MASNVLQFRRKRRIGPRLGLMSGALAAGILGVMAWVGPEAPSDAPASGAARAGAGTTVAAGPMLTGRAHIVDGDTLRIGGTTVRLLNIDAPESAQSCDGAPCGAHATDALRGIAACGDVTCIGDEDDGYGRLLAHCTVQGRDIGAELVLGGHAAAFRRYSTEYLRQEDQARAAGRGIWAAADPVMPWDWRRDQRAMAASADSPAPDGCRIKGNINRKGERIYHLPGRPYYDETRIRPLKGERWFCTEAEARAAGWRASGA